MSYEFDVVEIEPVTLTLTVEVMELTDVSTRMIGMFDVVYSWSREVGAKQTGQNYALYLADPQGVLVQVGFPILALRPESNSVERVDTATCQAAHTMHVGAYMEAS